MTYDPLRDLPFDQVEDLSSIPLDVSVDYSGGSTQAGGVGASGDVVPVEDEGTIVGGVDPQTVYVALAADETATVWWNGYAAGTMTKELTCPYQDNLVFTVPSSTAKALNLLAVRVVSGATSSFADVSVYGGYGGSANRYLLYGSTGWKWKAVQPGTDTGFWDPGFDDSTWNLYAAAPFGSQTGGCLQATVQTLVPVGYDLLLRRLVDLPKEAYSDQFIDTITGLTGGLDTVPPAVPTGLALSSDTVVAADGTSAPTLTATWNAAIEPDFDATEIEVERALIGDTDFVLETSGTGGALGTNTYAVKITAVGTNGGETTQFTAKSDALTSPERLYVNITARAGAAYYKIYCSVDAPGIDPLANGQTTTTTGSNVEITSVGAGAVGPSASTALAFLTPKPFRTGRKADGTPQTTFTTADVLGGVYYGVRIRAVDYSGNRSSFATPAGLTVGPDSTAPAVPTGLALNAGYKMLGVRWAQNNEPDLARYEVRWSPDNGGAPDPLLWVTTTTTGNALIIDGLVAGTLYFVQARAIDRSENVINTPTDSTAVNAGANPDKGWSNVAGDYKTATPTLVGSADVAFNSIITATLSASSVIDAAAIKSGTLQVGGTNNPTYLKVVTAGNVQIGLWDNTGLLIQNPVVSTQAVQFVNGVMRFTNAYVGPSTPEAAWGTAITAEGITADAIKLGTAPGGHNNIPNSSFELASFSTLSSKLWTVTGDWGGATLIGTPVNLDTSASDLKLTTVSY